MTNKDESRNIRYEQIIKCLKFYNDSDERLPHDAIEITINCGIIKEYEKKIKEMKDKYEE